MQWQGGNVDVETLVTGMVHSIKHILYLEIEL